MQNHFFRKGLTCGFIFLFLLTPGLRKTGFHPTQFNKLFSIINFWKNLISGSWKSPDVFRNAREVRYRYLLNAGTLKTKGEAAIQEFSWIPISLIRYWFWRKEFYEIAKAGPVRSGVRKKNNGGGSHPSTAGAMKNLQVVWSQTCKSTNPTPCKGHINLAFLTKTFL